MSDPRADALAIWLVEQQQQSGRLSRHESPPVELHLHQHHHAAPAPLPLAEGEVETVRLHPLFVATYILFVSLAFSVPLALIGAIVEAGRPQVIYQQPSRGGW